jgi:microcystin-dependent protein
MPAHDHTEVQAVSGGAYSGGATPTVVAAGGTSGSTGGGTAHNTIQPSVVMKYIIKI